MALVTVATKRQESNNRIKDVKKKVGIDDCEKNIGKVYDKVAKHRGE